MFKDSDKFDVKVVNGQLVISKVEEKKPLEVKEGKWYKNVNGRIGEVVIRSSPAGHTLVFCTDGKEPYSIDKQGRSCGAFYQYYGLNLVEEVPAPVVKKEFVPTHVACDGSLLEFKHSGLLNVLLFFYNSEGKTVGVARDVVIPYNPLCCFPTYISHDSCSQ